MNFDSHSILGSDIPIGLGMALAQNTRALAAFSAMSEKEQQAVIAHTHSIRSRQEMHAYVAGLEQPKP